jgi:beta-galactosidase
VIEFLLLCGEIHYFRVPRQLWRDRLLKLKRAGANCVSTYIPWNWHQPREDLVLFRDDVEVDHYVAGYYSRDLEGFLELARSLGLKVVARPGPYICAEWDGGGHPNWIYTKTRRLRSRDPTYMQYAKRWYEEVAKVLKPYVDSGVVVAVQVENEYFWGNEPYINELAKLVKELLNPPILFTNENPYSTQVPNAIDEYPSPWSLEGFDRKVESYVLRQRSLFKMIAELMGGWFTSMWHGQHPTDRLSIPSEWTEMLLKTAIARGLNNVNIYMFHGGTNPGYYTAKYITTSYDYEAAIREWGELSKRFYGLKRVYYFMNSLREVLESSEPSSRDFQIASNCSDVVARKGPRGSVVVLRNTTDWMCYQRVYYNGRSIPSRGVVRVPPKYAKMLLVDHPIGDADVKLVYTTGEVLLEAKIGGRYVLVVYGDRGESTETLLISTSPFERVEYHGDVEVEVSGLELLVTATHGDGDSVVYTETSTGSRILLIYTNRWRAERTWLLEDLLLVSNIYFVGDVKVESDRLTLELELDDESCGRVLLVSRPGFVGKVLVNGVDTSFVELLGGVYEFHIPLEYCVEGGRRARLVNVVELVEDPIIHDFRRVSPGTHLEDMGFYDNGLYVYRILFDLDRRDLEELRDKTIAVAGFSDYASISLNGVFVGSGYHLVEGSTNNALREGVNELLLIVESTGHPNDGLLYVPNGVYGGVYLGRVGLVDLSMWRRVDYKLPIGSRFDYAEFISNPQIDLQLLEQAAEVSSVKTPLSSPGLYLTELLVEDERVHYVLDPGEPFYNNYYHRALLFVNDEYVGPLIGPTDITRYLKRGVNKIALFIDWGVLAPKLRIYERRVDGAWFVQEKTYGIINKWYKSAPTSMRSVSLPVHLGGYAGRAVWVRALVDYEREPSPLNPVKMRLGFHGLRALVYVNGHLIGRVSEDSPTNELYVPEPAIKRGLNEITLLVLPTSGNAMINELMLEEYYVHRRVELTLVSSSR